MVRAGPLAPRAAAIGNPRLMIALIAVIERAKDERQGHSKSCDVSDHNTQLAPWRQTDHSSFDRSVQINSLRALGYGKFRAARAVYSERSRAGRRRASGASAPDPDSHPPRKFLFGELTVVPQVSCEVTRWGSCGYGPRGPERIVSLRL